MYDPVLGRFLSADPYIQYPDTKQGLNRYSYVDNNPLSFTDPSGLFLRKIFKSIGKAFGSLFKAVGSLFKNPYVRLAIGIAAGFYGGQAIALRALGAAAKGGLAFGVVAGASGGFIAGGIIGGNLESAFFGAISGGLAGGIGYYGSTLGAWKPIAHGLAQGFTQRIQGGSFKTGLLSGGFTSWGQGFMVGKITSGSAFLEFMGRSAASAVIGGTASAIGGGKFANGAQTGAFIYAFNEAMHTTLESGDKTRTTKAGEALNGASIRKMINTMGADIESIARSYGVDPDLIRSIIYEEQTHLLPFEATAEANGYGNTVGLGQVTVGLYGFPRDQLMNPIANIKAMALHLSVLGSAPLINSNFPTASLSTSYNCGSCTSITSYGRRVDSYYVQGGW